MSAFKFESLGSFPMSNDHEAMSSDESNRQHSQDWTHSDESAGVVGVRLGKAGRGPRPRLFRKGACQADGCGTDLKELPYYYQRNHICTKHNKIEEFECQGHAVRFCQRCGLAHTLSAFDGSRRSCRRQLERHNDRRRRQAAERLQRAAGAASPPFESTEPSASVGLPAPDSLRDVLEDLPSPASVALSGSSVASASEQDERVCRGAGGCLAGGCCRRCGGAGAGLGDPRALVPASAGGRCLEDAAGLEDTASCAGGDLDAPSLARDRPSSSRAPSLGPCSRGPAASAASACAARAASADDACSGAPRRPLAQLRERGTAALPARWRTGGLDAGVLSLGGCSHDPRRAALSVAAATLARAASRERSPCGLPRAQKENLAEEAPGADAKPAARARLLFSPSPAAAAMPCALQAVRALQSLQLSHSEAYAVFVRQQVAAAQSALSAAGRVLAAQEAPPVAA